MSAAEPAVTVIVPVHGDRGEIAPTLAALAAQELEGVGPVEVLLVDNGDNDGLSARVDASGLRATILTEPRRGSYAARNAAVAVARGPLLAFTDADCVPDRRWLAAGLAALAEHDGGFVGGAIEIVPRAGRRPSSAELWDVVHGLRQQYYVEHEGWAATANLFVAAATLRRVGAFDAELRSGGDREWGERATRAGVRGAYSPAALVLHPARTSLRALQRKIVRVSLGWDALSRSRGQTAFPPRELLRSAVPYTRSTLRVSRRIRQRGLGRLGQAEYVLVAHWLQYYRLAVQIRLAVAARLRRRSAH